MNQSPLENTATMFFPLSDGIAVLLGEYADQPLVEDLNIVYSLSHGKANIDVGAFNLLFDSGTIDYILSTEGNIHVFIPTQEQLFQPIGILTVPRENLIELNGALKYLVNSELKG